MKKKIALLTLVLTLVFTSGFAVAASIHGTFKGFPIVKLYIDGKETKTSVPAIVIDGTTLVPLRVISEAMGQEIRWDGKSQSVFVGKKPDYEVTQQEGFLISNVAYNVTGIDSIEFTGDVKNVSNRDIAGYSRVTVYLYDENMDVLNTEYETLRPMKKGETKSFKVEVHDVKSSVEAYEIIVQEN